MVGTGYSGIDTVWFSVPENTMSGGPGAGTPDAVELIDASDYHIPWNPLINEPNFDPPGALVRTKIPRMGNITNARVPGRSPPVAWTARMIYAGWPIIAAQMYNSVTIGSWVDDDNATIDMSMVKTGYSNSRPSQSVHWKQPDASENGDELIERDIIGTVVERYAWTVESGQYLIEEADVQMADSRVNEGVAMNTPADFAYNGFAYWNSLWRASNVEDGVLPIWSDAISFGAFGTFTEDFCYSSITYEITCEREMKNCGSRHIVTLAPRKLTNVTFTLDGVQLGSTPFSECWAEFDDLTAATCLIRWEKEDGGNTYYEQHQATNCILVNPGMLGAGEVDGAALKENTVVFEDTSGTVATFEGKYKQADTSDPYPYFYNAARP